MIENTKIHIKQVLDQHAKVGKKPVEFLALCLPVVKFFNLRDSDNYITIHGREYELRRKSSFRHSIYINGEDEYEIDIHCAFHFFQPYVGLREVYKICGCGERDYDTSPDYS